eukprot:7417796-Alexandrium_andersonii.AAC.1
MGNKVSCSIIFRTALVCKTAHSAIGKQNGSSGAAASPDFAFSASSPFSAWVAAAASSSFRFATLFASACARLVWTCVFSGEAAFSASPSAVAAGGTSQWPQHNDHDQNNIVRTLGLGRCCRPLHPPPDIHW